MKTATRAGFHLRGQLSAQPSKETMAGSIKALSVLGPQAEGERQRIRQQFETGANAKDTMRALCELADRNVKEVFAEALRVHAGESEGLCLLALGGYGRRLLFPYSDLTCCFFSAAKERKKNSVR